jgi:FixJ family two-component response regulator
MLTNDHSRADRLALHYIDADVADRARFAQAALQLGHHCELYESLAELSLHLPRRGLIILKDEPSHDGGIINAIAQLEQLGVWLSIIGVAASPQPRRIVETIKAGALDYLALPLDPARLERSLVRVSKEDKHVSDLRRRRIEARQKINRLTYREGEVLERLATGLSNKAIARDLGISPRTVEIHRANMMSKLEAPHSASAIRIALDARHVLA